MESIRDQWREMPAVYSDGGLLVGGRQVMQPWETPIMQAMAKAVTATHGDILEVGYGLGIAAQAILLQGRKSYHVIEAHPDIAAAARACGFAVIEGFWEHAIRNIPTESFDGVLFDTFPLDDSYFDLAAMFDAMRNMLRPGGVMAYFTGHYETMPATEIDLLCRRFSKVTIEKLGGLKPPADCDYPHNETMLCVYATK